LSKGSEYASDELARICFNNKNPYNLIDETPSFLLTNKLINEMLRSSSPALQKKMLILKRCSCMLDDVKTYCAYYHAWIGQKNSRRRRVYHAPHSPSFPDQANPITSHLTHPMHARPHSAIIPSLACPRMPLLTYRNSSHYSVSPKPQKSGDTPCTCTRTGRTCS
jgi:hypothetical protein